MERVRHKEFVAWMFWLRDQWNKPNLTQYYLMRIAQRVQQSVVRQEDQNKITIDHQLLEFREQAEEPKKQEELEDVGPSKEVLKQRAAMEKAVLFAMTGYKP